MNVLLYLVTCSVLSAVFCAAEKVSWTRQASSVEEVFRVMNEGDEKINLGTSREFIVVMGRTGTGKSTLIQFLTGNNSQLIAKPHPVRANGFIIDDGNKRIGSNNILSMTLFPELSTDLATNKTIVDLPGFLDTRPYAMEIGASYFIKKVLDHADKVKIIFTMSQVDTAAKGTFDDLLRSAAELIPDMEKLSDAIALVVTKVDSKKLNDSDSVADMYKYLKSVRQTIVGLRGTSEMVERKQQLIDAILDTKNGGKIAIFRKPTEEGPLSESTSMQDNKASLRKVIFQTTEFVPTNDIEFNYTVSADTIRFIQENISDEIVNAGLTQTKLISHDLTKHFKAKGMASNNIFTYFDEIRSFTELIDENVGVAWNETVFLDVLDVCFNVLAKDGEGVLLQGSRNETEGILKKYAFFKKFTTRLRNPVELWAKPLIEVSELMKYLNHWYSLLTSMGRKVQTFEIQKDKNRIIGQTFLSTDLAVENKNIDNAFVRVSDSKLFDEDRINKLSSAMHEHANEGKESDEFIIRDINFILNVMRRKVSCADGVLRVESNFISMANDVIWALNHICGKTIRVTTIHIAAFEKLYLDADLILNEYEVFVSILAPTWEVVGKWEINLDGVTGPAHSVVFAKSSDKDGDNGMVGSPGEPSGSFFGAGYKFINGDSLHISVNGGNGGPGQNGGDGADGTLGPYPELKSRFHFRDFLNYVSEKGFTLYNDADNVEPNLLQTGLYYTSNIAKQSMRIESGVSGTGGFNGGHGGRGGSGASSGKFELLSLGEDDTNIELSQNQGETGIDGKGGVGGGSGTGLASIRVNCKFSGQDIFSQSIGKSVECKVVDKIPGQLLPAGESGVDGVIMKDLKISRPAQEYDVSHAISQYRVGNIQHDCLDADISSRFEKAMQTETVVMTNMKSQNFVNELFSMDFESNQPKATKLFQYFSNLVGYLNQQNSTLEIGSNQGISKYLRDAIVSIVRTVHAKDQIYTTNPDFQVFADSSTQYVQRISKISGNPLLTTVNSRSSLQSDMDQMMSLVEPFSESYFVSVLTGTKLSTKEYIQAIDWNGIDENANSLGEINSKKDRMVNGGKSHTTAIEQTAIKANTILLQKMNNIFVQQIKDVAVLDLTLKFKNFLEFIGKASYIFGKSVDKGSEMRNEASDDFSFFPSILQDMLKYVENFEGKNSYFQDSFTVANLETIDRHFNNFMTPFMKSCKVAAKAAAESSTGYTDNDVSYEDEMTSTENIPIVDIEECLSSLPKDDSNVKMALRFMNYKRGSDVPSKIAKSFLLEYGTRPELTIPILKAVNEAGSYLTTVSKSVERFNEGITPIVLEINNGTLEYLKDVQNNVLDLSQWKVMKNVEKSIFFIRKVLSDLMLGDMYRTMFAQLEEFTSILWDVFHKIKYIQECSMFAQTGLVTSNSFVGPTNRDVGTEAVEIEILNEIVKRNALLAKYIEVVNVYQKAAFPFAKLYSEKLNLNKMYTRGKDTTTLASDIENAISGMQNAVTNRNSVVLAERNKRVKGVKFETNPFFVWKSHEYKTEIEQLLSGNEVMLFADILQSNEKSAIKFRLLNLNILISSRHVKNVTQSSLNSVLAANFDIELTHMGNSRYRCGQKYFIVRTDRVTFSYSFEGNGPRDPARKNDDYDKVLKREISLSPYALWKVKLVPLNEAAFTKLNQFKGKVDVSLHGTALCLNEAYSKFCESNLEKYYDVYEPWRFGRV